MGILLLNLKNISAFHTEYDVNCGLVIYGFSVLCSLYYHFVESFFFFFNHRWILYFVKRFSASIETILWFFLFFSLGMWWITWTCLQIWNHLCIPGINPTYLWCMILLMYCQVWLSIFCWRFLHLCSSVILACNILFVCYLYLVLVPGLCWPCRIRLEVFLPLKVLE